MGRAHLSLLLLALTTAAPSARAAVELTWIPEVSGAYCRSLPATDIQAYDGTGQQRQFKIGPRVSNIGYTCSRFVGNQQSLSPPEYFDTIQGRLEQGSVVGCTGGATCNGTVLLEDDGSMNTPDVDIVFRWTAGDFATKFKFTAPVGDINAAFTMTNPRCPQPSTQPLCQVTLEEGFYAQSSSMVFGAGQFDVRLAAYTVYSGVAATTNALTLSCKVERASLALECFTEPWFYEFGDALKTITDVEGLAAEQKDQPGVSMASMITAGAPDQWNRTGLFLVSSDICNLKTEGECAVLQPPCAYEANRCTMVSRPTFTPSGGPTLTTKLDNTVTISFTETQWAGEPVEVTKIFYTVSDTAPGRRPEPTQFGEDDGPESCWHPCELELAQVKTYNIQAVAQVEYEGRTMYTAVAVDAFNVKAGLDSVCYVIPRSECMGICKWEAARGVCLPATPIIRAQEPIKRLPDTTFQNGDLLEVTYPPATGVTERFNKLPYYRTCYIDTTDDDDDDDDPAGSRDTTCDAPYLPYNATAGVELSYPVCSDSSCPTKVVVAVSAYLNITDQTQPDGLTRTTASDAVEKIVLLEVVVERAPPADNSAFKTAVWVIVVFLVLAMIVICIWYRRPAKPPKNGDIADPEEMAMKQAQAN